MKLRIVCEREDIHPALAELGRGTHIDLGEVGAGHPPVMTRFAPPPFVNELCMFALLKGVPNYWLTAPKIVAMHDEGIVLSLFGARPNTQTLGNVVETPISFIRIGNRDGHTVSHFWNSFQSEDFSAKMTSLPLIGSLLAFPQLLGTVTPSWSTLATET